MLTDWRWWGTRRMEGGAGGLKQVVKLPGQEGVLQNEDQQASARSRLQGHVCNDQGRTA